MQNIENRVNILKTENIVCNILTHKKGGNILKKIISVMLAMAMLFCLTACMSLSEMQEITTEDVGQHPTAGTTTQEEPQYTTRNTTQATTRETTQKYEENITLGQKNALQSAKNYLSFSHFSYEGLIEQLEFEKYSHEEAVFAADNCGADWNEQALKSAKSYLSFSHFSYTGLIEQLEFEKFTTEQATYGADNCGADWYEQAAKSAKSYLEFSQFSREGLIDQLVFEGFTYEQAVYGVEANGY